MNILVLSHALYDTAPGARFRFEQWARYLEKDGFRFTFVPFEDEVLHQVLYTPRNYVRKATSLLKACVRRLARVGSVRDFDLVLVYREAAMVGPAVIESLIARTGVPIVYDFDDPIWLPYRSPTNALFSRLKWPGKTREICRMATSVVVGNRLLAGWAAPHSRRVDVVPSTVDLAAYPVKPEQGAGPTVTLGWTGSHSTLPFLDVAMGTLRRLAARHPMEFLVISHTDGYAIDDFPARLISKRWNAATEATDLHAMDIGLAPFPDTGWTPWRCHGKVLQYMAAGIPTVTSNLGVLPDYIRDGENGFLAASDDEWFEKTTALIEDAGLRRRMGLAGRKTIEERFSAQVWVPKVREIFTEAAASRRA
jgi:glycosyltransferase involved in cell wall biosynthesis